MTSDADLKIWLEEAIYSYHDFAYKQISENPEQWEVCEEKSIVQPNGKITLCNKEGEMLKVYYYQRNKGRSRNTRNKSAEAKAIMWARSLKYPVPNPPDGCFNGFIAICGFLLGIIPGIIWIIYVDTLTKNYRRRIEELIDKWIESGKPDPYNLPSSKKQQLNPVNTDSTIDHIDTKMRKLNELKEQQLISDNEYEQMRAKFLDEFGNQQSSDDHQH